MKGLTSISREAVCGKRVASTESLLVALCAVCAIISGSCREDATSSSKPSQVSKGLHDLRDPLSERHGSEKARQLLRTLALRDIGTLERLDHFARFADVMAQCEVARSIIDGDSFFEKQRPVVVFAGLANLEVGTRFHVHAYNPNRETDQVIVRFRLRGRDMKCIWRERLHEKEEVYDVALGLEPQFLSVDELCGKFPAVGSGVQILDLPELPVGHPDYARIPLPKDPNVPVYAAIHDRAGAVSDYVLSHCGVDDRLLPGRGWHDAEKDPPSMKR